MIDIQGRSGQVSNFIPEIELLKIIRIMQAFPMMPVDGGFCHGVDSQHRGYIWFKNHVLAPVENYFNRELKLIFSMYLDLHKPFSTHSDIRPCEGTPLVSCLIPCSVDYQAHLCSRASTDVFNELDTGQGPPAQPNLQASYIWNRGDLIWWHTSLFHNSGIFRDFKTKQGIVLHTYE